MQERSLCAFIGLGVLWASIPAGLWAQALVIEGGTLINGTGTPPVENAVVVMEGSRIKAVGTKGRVSYPANAQVIKADGKFILPGLIDVLIHYRGWDPQMFLHYGVTTVFDPSNPTEWIVAQRDMVNHGKIPGPRMFVCGDPIAGPKEFARPDAASEVSGGNIRVTTVEQAQEAVRRNVAAHVDMIQVEESLTPELLKAVVDEAAKHKIPVVGHSRDARDASQAGLKYILHSVPVAHAVYQAEDPSKLASVDWIHIEFPGAENGMNPQFFGPLIKLMVSEGVAFDPTFGLQWRPVNPRAAEWSAVVADIAKEPGIEFVPEAIRQSWVRPARPPSVPLDQLAASFKKMQDFTREFAQAGGKVVVGTDSMGGQSLQGVAESFEMQSLVDAGLTPMQTIVGATRSAAELIHKEKDLGTLEPGKLADLVVVDEDPLKNIAAIRKVAVVVKDGKVVNRTYDSKFVNPIPVTRLNGQMKGPANGSEISTLKPMIVAQGDKDVNIQLTGSRFTPQSAAQFDSIKLKTHFVSDSQLTAVISRADLQKVGTYAITVVNPDSGVKSNLRYFIVNFKY